MKYGISAVLRNPLSIAIVIGALLAIAIAATPRQASAAPPCDRYAGACVSRTSEINRTSTIRGRALRDLMVRTSGPKVRIKNPGDRDSFEAYRVSGRSCTATGKCSSSAVDLILKGVAKDNEDGRLKGTSLYWTVQAYDSASNVMGRPLMVGSGQKVNVRLFAFGDPLFFRTTYYDITMHATDSDGNLTKETIRVGVYLPSLFDNFYENR